MEKARLLDELVVGQAVAITAGCQLQRLSYAVHGVSALGRLRRLTTVVLAVNEDGLCCQL